MFFLMWIKPSLILKGILPHGCNYILGWLSVARKVMDLINRWPCLQSQGSYINPCILVIQTLYPETHKCDDQFSIVSQSAIGKKLTN